MSKRENVLTAPNIRQRGSTTTMAIFYTYSRHFRISMRATYHFALLTVMCTCGHYSWGQWPIERGNPAATGATATNLPLNLSIIWDFPDGGAFEATPVVDSGHVFACDAEGGVFCLKLAGGSVQWQSKIDSGFLAAPAVKGDTLVLGDYDGMVYALSTVDGKRSGNTKPKAKSIPVQHFMAKTC